MAAIGAGGPTRAEEQDSEGLTKWQKVIGVGLLLFYFAMIAVTIATLPYVTNDVASRAGFE
jgi:hypothetical protein